MKELRTIGRTFNAEIEVYNFCKYTATAEDFENEENIKKVVVHDIESWEIVTDEDAKAIEAETDGSCIDEFHEYLVLNLVGGETSTWRNSYVDMFRI